MKNERKKTPTERATLSAPEADIRNKAVAKVFAQRPYNNAGKSSDYLMATYKSRKGSGSISLDLNQDMIRMERPLKNILADRIFVCMFAALGTIQAVNIVRKGLTSCCK